MSTGPRTRNIGDLGVLAVPCLHLEAVDESRPEVADHVGVGRRGEVGCRAPGSRAARRDRRGSRPGRSRRGRSRPSPASAIERSCHCVRRHRSRVGPVGGGPLIHGHARSAPVEKCCSATRRKPSRHPTRHGPVIALRLVWSATDPCDAPGISSTTTFGVDAEELAEVGGALLHAHRLVASSSSRSWRARPATSSSGSSCAADVVVVDGAVGHGVPAGPHGFARPRSRRGATPAARSDRCRRRPCGRW